jgi:hypothetical protein
MTGRRLGVAVVAGRSMEPTLHEGDRLLVLWGGRPKVGRMAVVQLPPSDEAARPVSVKRVTGPDPGNPGAWWMERDNPAEGVDSWLVGGIPDDDILGRVLVRLPDFTRRVRRA